MIALILVAAGAGAVLGAVGAIYLRQRGAQEEPQQPVGRASMPSWTEEAQQIYRCARCWRRIVKDREADRVVVRVVGDRVEHFHASCWEG